tara:strand:+ start:41238 stop:41474 length:237 start_codon:yes stop_codon:yes gene_type:complete
VSGGFCRASECNGLSLLVTGMGEVQRNEEAWQKGINKNTAKRVGGFLTRIGTALKERTDYIFINCVGCRRKPKYNLEK